MIQFKQVVILYIGLLLQINCIQTEWNGKFIDCGSYYVPYVQNGCSSFVTSGPVNYVPAQGPGNNRPVFSPINQYPANGPYSSFAPDSKSVPYPQNVPFPPNGPYYPPGPYPPLFPNLPANVYGQGLDQAMALSSAYPNQPIIVINNGGTGDSNGNEGKRGGLFGGDGANLGDLAAIFLASKAAHKHGHEGGPESESGPEIAYQPVGAGPVASPSYPQGSSSATNNINSNPGTANDRPNSSSGTVTHITIILPSSGATVTVEEKNKKKKGKNKNRAKKQKKKVTKKDEEEDSETDEDVNKEEVAVDKEESEDENVKGN